MSWREICRLHTTSNVSRPKWHASPEQRKVAKEAARRIFGGAALPGMSAQGASRGLGGFNRKLMSSKDKEGLLNRLDWPYIRPEVLSGRMYREREKLAAKVQAGLKGASAGAVEAAKEAKLKKKK